MSVMSFGFTEASHPSYAGVALATSAAGVDVRDQGVLHARCYRARFQGWCIHRTCPGTLPLRAASATSPLADDPAIIGRRSGHASYLTATGVSV